jgi:hypothetical protein
MEQVSQLKCVLRGLAEQTEIDFDRQPLGDVLDYLKQHHDCEIQVDGRLREQRKESQPVTCHIRGVASCPHI